MIVFLHFFGKYRKWVKFIGLFEATTILHEVHASV